MISRIAIVLLCVGVASGAEPEKKPLPEVFQEIDGTRVLSQDLSSPLDATALERVSNALKKEAGLPNLSATRKMEIDFANGLMALGRREFDRAISLFNDIPPDHVLRDAALFFKIKTLRLRAEEAFKNANFANGTKLCSEARWALLELRDYEPGPFTDSQSDEARRVMLCYVRGLVMDRRFREAKGLLFSLLGAAAELAAPEKSLLLSSILATLKEEKEPEDQQRLAAEALKVFPGDATLKKFLSEPSKPPAGLQVSSKKELPEPKPRAAPEEALFREASGYASRGQPQKAVEILIKIQREYPGSIAAAKAGAKLQIILESALAKEKTAPSFVKELKTLPGKVLYSLGKSLWDRDFISEAQELFEQVVKNDPYSQEAGNSLYFLGRIEEDRGDWSTARKNFERVVAGYSASPFYGRAHFKVGWLSFLLNDYPKAIEWLEYDRAIADSPSRKAEDLFWISKVYEKQGNPEKAAKYAREIGLIAPVSYYAVLADQIPPLSDPPPKSPALTFQDHWNLYRIRRAKAFLFVGLPSAAAYALGQIDLDEEPNALREVALLYNAARQYGASISVAARLVNRTGDVSLPKDLAKAFFPIDYEQTVYAEAQANQLDPLLLFSLIKQESAYREDAESRTGALGLMQLMPATARDVAAEMSETVPVRTELLVSGRNVKLGARYLASLLKRYNGNLVYALGAYNGGTNRVDAWKNRWGKLPVETFIELIPFEETRNYVKSIIRNYAYYSRILENRKMDLKTLIPQPKG